MAIMKLTAFNGGMKGKVGGTVFQGGRMGQVVKNAPAGSPTSTALINATSAGAKLTKADAGRGLLSKQFISQLASKWRNLSTADMLTWRTGAIGFPFKNKFGEVYTGSGFQVYMSINARLAQLGLDALAVCPSPGVLLNAEPFTVTADGVSKVMDVHFTAATTGYILKLAASRPVSKGIIFPVNGFSDIYQFDGSEASPFDFTDWWTNYFGSMPASATIWYKLTAYNAITAQPGAEQYFKLTY